MRRRNELGKITILNNRNRGSGCRAGDVLVLPRMTLEKTFAVGVKVRVVFVRTQGQGLFGGICIS